MTPIDDALPRFENTRIRFEELLDRVEPILSATTFRGSLHGPGAERRWYTVAEAAKILGKKKYTVREYCRLGRINATREEALGRGGLGRWCISAEELRRIQEEGLLPQRGKH